MMRYCSRLVFLALLLFLTMGQSSYAHANYRVSFKNIFVPIGSAARYIEVHTWYPTEARVLLRTIEREGKQFLLAKNAKIIEKEFDLIVISTPPFTNSYDYASFAHALARKGFVVAIITHIGDNKEDMLFTMTGWQMMWRAVQIKEVIEYIQEDPFYTIKPYSISSISFAETALAPLLLENFELSSKEYHNFCAKATEDPFCNYPLNTEIERIIVSIDSYTEQYNNSREQYEKEAAKVGQENLKLQTEWDKITQRALARDEQIPEEPQWLSLPDKPIEMDLKKSYIKNYFFIEPLLPFLFVPTKEPFRDIEIFNFMPTFPVIPKTEEQSTHLQGLFSKKVNILNLDKFNHLDSIDKKPWQNDNKTLQLPDLMSNITDVEQRNFIDLLVKNITENIVNY